MNIMPSQVKVGEDFTIHVDGLAKYNRLTAEQKQREPTVQDKISVTINYDNPRHSRNESFKAAIHREFGYIDYTVRAHTEPGPFTVTVWDHIGNKITEAHGEVIDG
jgi:hypothetical protein